VEEFVVRKDLLEESDGTPLTLPNLLGPRVPEDEAWRDFEQRPDDYHAVLAEELTTAGKAAQGFLGKEPAASVGSQRLDGDHLRVPLRDFQSFGARFALVQRRVILGDEMGLGRAIQAIAAMAHLRAEGATHFLVACPASVLLNWVRDLTVDSLITVHALHGRDRHAAKKRWIESGGVAVVPLETLADHDVSRDVAVGMFVVDDAHRLKDPGTARARAVAAWGDRAHNVLFLTGTPMEDRVQDLRTLVGLLGSRAVMHPKAIRPEAAVLGPLAFRAAVAPVYLRRTQRDVLEELPDIVHVDELVAFGRADSAAYRSAVMSGDFTAMRRAAYAVPTTSAKLRRLRRLVEEAAGEERKVVVLSAFGEVLDAVRDALGTLAPVTAGTPADRRREIVDAFAAAPGHAVLPAEIGVGDLTPRGASVVILCEPHPDRDLERRAIGHVHGAGLTGPLLVHRLVAPGSVDERVADDPASVIEDEQAAASSPPGS
jgi:SNF2 family DNA or RNA helicase